MTGSQLFTRGLIGVLAITGLVVAVKAGYDAVENALVGKQSTSVNIPAAILLTGSGAGSRCVVAVPKDYMTDDGEIWLHTHGADGQPDTISWTYNPNDPNTPYVIKFRTQPFAGDPSTTDPLQSQPLDSAVNAKCSNFFSSCYYSYDIYLKDGTTKCNKDANGNLSPYGVHITK